VALRVRRACAYAFLTAWFHEEKFGHGNIYFLRFWHKQCQLEIMLKGADLQVALRARRACAYAFLAAWFEAASLTAIPVSSL
jgi:hypothetical protein